MIKKLRVRYPNYILQDKVDTLSIMPIKEINLLFIGNHFIRKGGLVALMIAAEAKNQEIPVKIEIVSSMEMGATSWVDPLKPGHLENLIKHFRGYENITFHGPQSNQKVLEMISNAHYTLLPTFSDTFGYSAIESMANYVPVIATKLGALPEFINNENGVLLDFPTDAVGEWTYINSNNRYSDEYANLFAEQCKKLAMDTIPALIRTLNDQEYYLQKRENANNTVKKLFCAHEASTYWDNEYKKAA